MTRCLLKVGTVRICEFDVDVSTISNIEELDDSIIARFLTENGRIDEQILFEFLDSRYNRKQDRDKLFSHMTFEERIIDTGCRSFVDSIEVLEVK